MADEPSQRIINEGRRAMGELAWCIAERAALETQVLCLRSEGSATPTHPSPFLTRNSALKHQKKVAELYRAFASRWACKISRDLPTAQKRGTMFDAWGRIPEECRELAELHDEVRGDLIIKRKKSMTIDQY